MEVKPLCTTYDGVSLYAGDAFAYIGDDNFIKESYMLFAKDVEEFDNYKMKYFSTKEKAEEYLKDLYSQNVLSINDILERFSVYKQGLLCYTTVSTYELRRLAEKKLENALENKEG